MKGAIAAGIVLALALAACGVKSNLERPDGRMLNDRRPDPSKPPIPLGDPGGTLPPYPTGP